MSSPSEQFACHWRGSRALLVAYLVCQVLALVALSLLAIPLSLALLGLSACAAHGCWVLPRHILLNHPRAVTGLRRDPFGWQLFSVAGGWQAVQLCRDSLALPGLVIVRYRQPGQWFSRSLCIGADALEPVQHRRLRVRLKFSRRRWVAAG